MTKKFLFFIPFLVSPLYAENQAQLSPTYVVRSQGRDAARKVVGLSDHSHLYMQEKFINFAATAEYSRSFDGDEIAKCLFGDDLVNCNQILIQGSAITGDDRNAKAWLADYFYLAPDYNSYFSIKPSIQNVLLDLDLFVGLNSITEGLYFRAHGPITYTRWNLQFEEPCDIVTTNSFVIGYFDRQAMPNNQLLRSFGEYAQGQKPLNTLGLSGQPSLGVQFMGLQYAQIDRCEHSRTGFADLRMELGWDFIQNDDYHFGLNAQVVAPTGNRTKAQFAFDPTIGNRNHWEAGAGLTAHYVFWRAQGEDRHAGFHFDLNVTHMNKAREQRTFDLCGRPNSRYMLAMKMGTPVDFLLGGSTSASSIADLSTLTRPNKQFKNIYSPVANLTTVNIEVSSKVQADLVAMFHYAGTNFEFNLGYNFWARSCENFTKPGGSIAQCCPNLCDGSRDQWALKGDAHVFGFRTAVAPLSATQCAATIHGGTNALVASDDSDCAGVSTFINCGVDNAQFAYASTDGDPAQRLLHDLTTAVANDEANHIKTSVDPKFINCCDINFQRVRGISNKIFGHLSYTWHNSYDLSLGVGGFAEFGKTNSKCDDDCTTSCNTTCNEECVTTPNCTTACDDTCCDIQCCTPCTDCALTQWGVWLKGSITFGTDSGSQPTMKKPSMQSKQRGSQSTKNYRNTKELAYLGE